MGSLVPKEGRHTLLYNTLLVIPPWSSKPPLFVCSPRSLHQGSLHATHGQQGIHSLGGCKPDKRLTWETLETIGMGLQGTDRISVVLSKQWSVKNQWPSAREWLSRGANGPVLRCNAGQQ